MFASCNFTPKCLIVPNNAGYDGAEMKFAVNPYTLWSGDANVDGKVKYSGPGNDASIISYTVTTYPANTTQATNYDLAFLYHSSDVNMNGKVKYSGPGNDASAVLGSVLAYPLNTSQGYNYDLMLEQLPSPSQVVASSTPATTDALQTIDYSYNIRGGLQCLNCSSNQVANGNNQNDLFSMKLDFHEDGRYYDGNISKQTWLNAASTASRSYLYTYDKASRITNAAYAGGTYTGENYGMSITGYDKNGNIQGLNRTGAWAITNGVPSGFNAVDALSYFYSGNRLSRVEDGISGNLDVGDFKNNNANSTDYTYWQDGSLKTDLNKGISQIDYDAFLQKPKQINFSDGRRINFYYDTQGQKLKQTTSVGDETHYASKAVYQRKNAVTLLYQISQAEGRELPFGSAFVQEYEYRDLVGNLRLSFKDATIGSPTIRNAPTIVQAVEYDPYGLELNGLGYESTVSPSKFKFTGKESINDFSLGWIDFGARMYDRQIGRWSAVDPLAEKTFNISTYTYANNNPVNMVDRDGRYAVSVHYKITYDALRGLGYSKKQADLIAHYSSTYADHPERMAMLADLKGHGIAPSDNHLAYRSDIDYSVTAESQLEKNSVWHSMMSDEEANNGMARIEAKERGLKFGWDNIFAQKDGEDLGKLGQGLHALQDAMAHQGVKTSDHLFGPKMSNNTKSIAMFWNDMYGSTKQASSLTRSAIIVSNLVQGKTVNLKDGDKLNFTGMSSKQFTQVTGLLIKQGFRGRINTEEE